MAFPTGWTSRIKCTVQNGKVSGSVNLTNFPGMLTDVNLGSAVNGIFDADGTHPAINGGGDLVWSTDEAGTDRRALEVVTFETNNDPSLGKAELYVLNPDVDDATDTDGYLWWGKAAETQPAVGAAFGRNAVWTAYDAVWHLNNLVDSTGNGANLTAVGSPSIVDGDFGKGYDLDGATQYLTYSTLAVTSYPCTMEGYCKSNSAAAIQTILTIEDVGTIDDEWSLELRGDQASDPVWMRSKRTGPSGSASSIGYSVGTYLLASGTMVNDNFRRASVDGATQGTNATNSPIITGNLSGGAIGVLRRITPTGYFDGIIEEVRAANSDLTLAWRLTNSNNLSDPATFWVIGARQDVGGGGSPSTPTGTPMLIGL